MYTLILIWSLKTMYNQNLDTVVVERIKFEDCASIADVLTKDLKSFNPDIQTKFICELNK
jgi:hypothetical protein